MQTIIKFIILTIISTLSLSQDIPSEFSHNCFSYTTQEQCQSEQAKCVWQETPIGMFCVNKVIQEMNCFMYTNNKTECEINKCKWKCGNYACVNTEQQQINCLQYTEEQCGEGCQWRCFAPMCIHGLEHNPFFNESIPQGHKRILQGITEEEIMKYIKLVEEFLKGRENIDIEALTYEICNLYLQIDCRTEITWNQQIMLDLVITWLKELQQESNPTNANFKFDPMRAMDIIMEQIQRLLSGKMVDVRDLIYSLCDVWLNQECKTTLDPANQAMVENIIRWIESLIPFQLQQTNIVFPDGFQNQLQGDADAILQEVSNLLTSKKVDFEKLVYGICDLVTQENCKQQISFIDQLTLKTIISYIESLFESEIRINFGESTEKTFLS